MNLKIDTKKSHSKEIEEFLRLKDKKSGQRKYQIEAYDSLNDKLLNDDSRIAGLLVLPTGGGKTRVAVSWALDKAVNQGYKVLWIAHRHMLLEQAYHAFYKFSGLVDKDKLQIKIVSGKNNHSNPKEINYKEDDIVIAMIDSLRNKKLLREKFKNIDKLLVIVDEAHHAQADTYYDWLGILDEKSDKNSGWFRKQYRDNKIKKLKILGLTATPINSNSRKEEKLKAIFDGKQALFKINTSELMKLGILSRPILNQISTESLVDMDAKNLEGTKQQVEDSLNKQLAENADRNHFIIETYKKSYQDGKKTLIFAVNRKHADILQGFFKQDGFECETVYSGKDYSKEEGYDKKTNNDEIIDKFRKEDSGLNILINVGILTEGSDIPNIQNLFITRIVGSETLYTQMIGRALRGLSSGGTKYANIVTFEDNIKNYSNILSLKDILADGGWEPDDISEKSLKDIDVWNDKKYSIIQIQDILMKAHEKLDEDGFVKRKYRYKMLSLEKLKNFNLNEDTEENKKCCYILAQRDMRKKTNDWNFERKEQFSFVTNEKSDFIEYDETKEDFYFITQKEDIRLPRLETRYFQKYYNEIRTNSNFGDAEILPSYGIPVGEYELRDFEDNIIDRIPVFKYQQNSYKRFLDAYSNNNDIIYSNNIKSVKDSYFSEANNFIAVSERALSNLINRLKEHSVYEFIEYEFDRMDEVEDFIENLARRWANKEEFNLDTQYDNNESTQSIYSRKAFRDEVQSRADIINGYEEEAGKIVTIEREWLKLERFTYRKDDEFNKIHDISKIYNSASKLVCKNLNYETEILKFSPKEAQWSKKAYKSYMGTANGINIYTKHIEDKSQIIVNSILCSKSIPSFVVEYIMYHEMLHFELRAGHTPEFRKFEAMHPHHAEAQQILAEVSDWIDNFYDDNYRLYSLEQYTIVEAKKLIEEKKLILPSIKELSILCSTDAKFHYKNIKENDVRWFLSNDLIYGYSSYTIPSDCTEKQVMLMSKNLVQDNI
ncbi:MAG: DEAD/DEAH box helicase [Campylobacterales bacterium]|nr:DEAD/DEAH box helicase [Campylobacterales bacterium]